MGRKKAFLIGLLGFAAASALGGVAMNANCLRRARTAGRFRRTVGTRCTALITVTFHDPKERAKAFGVFGAISGGGAAIGLLLGGVLTEYFVALVPGRQHAHRDPGRAAGCPLRAGSKAHGDTSYDIPGAVTVTGGLLALVYGFTKAAPPATGLGALDRRQHPRVVRAGRGPARAFFVIESRSAHPLLPLRVIRNSNRAGATSRHSWSARACSRCSCSWASSCRRSWLLPRCGRASPPAVQRRHHPGAGVAANLLPKVGPRPLMIPGLIAGGVGMLLLAQLQADSGYLSHVLPAMVIMSLSMAFVFIPTASVALHAIDQHDAGVASAMINTSQQVGGSLGTALMNTVAVTATSSFLVANAAAGPVVMPEALTHGFTRGFYVGAALLLPPPRSWCSS